MGGAGYVVGSFNDLGGEVKPGSIVGNFGDTDKLKEVYEQHAGKQGELNTRTIVKNNKPGAKSKRGRPKKKAPSYNKPEKSLFDEILNNASDLEHEPLEPVDTEYSDRNEYLKESEPENKIRVTFSNNFGSIRVKVAGIMDCPMAYGLIFSCEDDIIFIPKPAETLSLTMNGVEQLVYYPDVLFSLPNSNKKIMILFKQKDSSYEPDDTLSTDGDSSAY